MEHAHLQERCPMVAGRGQPARRQIMTNDDKALSTVTACHQQARRSHPWFTSGGDSGLTALRQAVLSRPPILSNFKEPAMNTTLPSTALAFVLLASGLTATSADASSRRTLRPNAEG